MRAGELLRAVSESLGPCALHLPWLHLPRGLQARRGPEGQAERERLARRGSHQRIRSKVQVVPSSLVTSASTDVR